MYGAVTCVTLSAFTATIWSAALGAIAKSFDFIAKASIRGQILLLLWVIMVVVQLDPASAFVPLGVSPAFGGML